MSRSGGELPGRGPLRDLRHLARGPRAGRAGALAPRLRSRRARARPPAGAAHRGRHPQRRDRGQGRRLLGRARAADRRGVARLPRRGDPGVRADLQRRWPRALRAQQPAQPARPRGDGLPHHRRRAQPQPRLGQGRRARDGRDARAVAALEPHGVRRSAHHRWRQVPARRRGAGRAAHRPRRRARARGRRAPGRAGRARHRPRAPAARVLSRRSSPTTIRRRASPMARRRRGSRSSTRRPAIASASWSRPTRGGPTPSA